jgi:SlyX protein
MSTALEELEIKLAFLENTVEQLSQEIAAQQQQIALMERLNKELISRVKGLQDASGINSSESGGFLEPKPPHY